VSELPKESSSSTPFFSSKKIHRGISHVSALHYACNTNFCLPFYPIYNFILMYHRYREEFKGRGRISFKNSGNYFEPANLRSVLDLRSTQRGFDFSIGWFAGPWTDGDYPKSLKDTLGDILPTLTAAEKSLIKGSCDFYALDGYTSYEAYGTANDEACAKNRSAPGYPDCAPARQMRGGFPMGPAADSGANWLKSAPGGIRKYLKKIKDIYPAIPDIMITEMGFAEPFESKMTSLEEILWDLKRAVSSTKDFSFLMNGLTQSRTITKDTWTIFSLLSNMMVLMLLELG
jgi:Glycosyl hydrolase family 1